MADERFTPTLRGMVHVRFYADLGHFLPYARRGVTFDHPLSGRTSIKDLVEALGVPHTEIDLLLVNGDSVGFDHIVRDGDRISVYPPFASFDISGLSRVRVNPPAPRFVLDVHLGKLAVYLRLLGFDTLLPENHDDAHLARIAQTQDRILLTRDRGLLKRAAVKYGFCPRSTSSRRQLAEVLRRYDLFDRMAPFTRCPRCNGVLQPVEKAAVWDRLLPGTREHHDRFWVCADCGQLYWRGAHFQRLLALVAAAKRGGG